MAGKCQIKRQYSRDRASLRGSSHCMPGAAAQSCPSGEHYPIRLETGFRVKHNVIRYLYICSTQIPKEPTARICPPSMLSPVVFRRVWHQPLRGERRDPPRRDDRPVPPMSVSTINCQLMHPVNSTVVIHIVDSASLLCSLYLVPADRVQICSPAVYGSPQEV